MTKLKKYLKENGIKQKYITDHSTFLTKNRVSNLVIGKGKMRVEEALEIANILKVPLKKIL